jgi:multiple sugar transport system permease protein
MITLPLSLDGLIVTAFIIFASCWNEALFASAVTSQHAVTIPVFILTSRAARGVLFNYAAVDTILAIAPPLILSLLVQRYLARGLSFGAVKA